MKNLFISILVLLLIAGLYLTNPTKEDFVDYITHKIENKEQTGLEQILKSLFSRPLAKILTSNTKVEDYQLFSFYTIKLGDNQRKYLGIFDGFYKIAEKEN